MAIVQISRITQRKGLAENLPQLAGGELGWAIDDRRLYIGNGTLAEGAPAVGNTEVLTEYSDILDLASSYTYKGEAGGYIVQTGPTASDPVTRTLQAVFDDYASIKDFGAVGDGETDDTAAINRAFYQLYCRDINTSIRRSLFFPAGKYRVTDTILIPPYARLIGEGANSSIIEFSAEDYSSTSAYSINALVFDGTNYYRALQDVPAGISLSNILYWNDLGILNDFYVGRTTDSLQQTYPNIGTNGAITPILVEISDMAFSTAQKKIDIFLVEEINQMSVQNCNFYGPYIESELDSAVDNVSCISFSSSLSNVVNQIVFDKCHFSNMIYAVNTDEQIQGVVFSNSKFDTLYQGILLGTGTPVLGGPTGVRVTQNLFDQIYAQGIIIGNSSDVYAIQKNISGYNIFLNVGNNFQGAGFPETAIIELNSNNNVSVGDMFERSDEYSTGLTPRIYNNDAQVFSLDNGARYKFGSYNREAGGKIYLDISAPVIPIGDGTPDNRLSDINVDSEFDSFIMEYRFHSVSSGTTRYGRMTVVGVVTGGSGTLAYTDEYTETGITGLILSASQTGTTISIEYSSPTDEGYFTWSLSHF